MKKNEFIYGALIVFLFIAVSCKSPKEVEKPFIVTQINLDAEDTLLVNVDHSTRIQGTAHSGKYSYHADSAHIYGGTVKIDLDDTLVGSPIRLILNFWMKSSNPTKGNGLAVAFQDNNTMMSWAGFDLINYGAKPNEWINIVDSITIPAENYLTSGMFFKIFAYAPNLKANVDIDDVNITVKQMVKVME